MERLNTEAREEGREEGRGEGCILEYIDLRREDGYSDEEITDGLIKRFHLTTELAREYVCRMTIY